MYVTSSSHQRRPWRADVGNAWWLLCHPSPKAITPKKRLLRLWSWVSKGRVPQMWQTELMLHVRWCTMQMRTNPPQSTPSRAAVHELVMAPAMTPGTSSPSATQSGNKALIARTRRSARRSAT
jgi:hypothetical protein